MSSPIGNKFRGTGLSNSEEDRQRSAPPVIRQLKPPPEIWELVHPVTSSKGKTGQPFLSRLMSKWTVLVLIAFVVGTAAGVGVSLWNHPAARAFLSGPQSQIATPKQQPVVTETAPAEPSPAAAAAELAPVTTNESQPIADSTTPPAVVSNETETAANENTTRPFVKKGFVRQVRTPDAALGVRVGSATSPNNQRATESVVAPQRSSTESTSTKPKSGSAEGSQVITPVKPAAASKPKVIPWP